MTKRRQFGEKAKKRKQAIPEHLLPPELQGKITHKIVKTSNGYEIDAYDAYWPLMQDLALELTAYRINWQGNAFLHLRNAHDILWPQDIPTWNDWTERRFRAHIDLPNKLITLAGGANTGKSWDCGKLLLLWWMANPQKRTAIVCSTTIDDLNARIWGYLQRFYTQSAIDDMPGRLYSAKPPRILYNPNDKTHGIFAKPLKSGTADATIASLIGIHPDEGLLVIVDEGTDVSSAFMDALGNWERAPWFQLIVLGNSKSKFDPHGLLSAPKDGWDTINPDFDTEWETRRGVCLYFDCYQSPAIHEKDLEKKKLLSRFLFSEESIADGIEKYGEKSISFWRFYRGFWPPDDLTLTVLTPLLIDKFKATAPVAWGGYNEQVYRLAGLDPALSGKGDNCVLRFANFGIAANGHWTLDFGGAGAIHYIRVDVTDPNPPEYQIAEQVIKLCKENGVDPRNLSVDVWGIGSGLSAILRNTWSNEFHPVVAAGAPSDTIIDKERRLTARDLFDRRSSEIYFSIQKFVQTSQIRGLDPISVEQFCTRKYEFKNRKIRIETKLEYRHRMGKVDIRYTSPDESDAAALILDLARQRYGFMPTTRMATDVAAIDRKPGWRELLASEWIREQANESLRNVEREDGAHPISWSDGFLSEEFLEEE